MGLRSCEGISPDGMDSYYRYLESKRAYRPTTRDARRAISPEEEAIIKEGANRVREMIAWEDTVDPEDLKK